ncbi:hypothetical protein, partial [Clostridium perfringens]|uniref:hypothetical protein n=1 Tax=Clostridium perfringens TaxID=1502 RepID=UPI0032DA5A43
IKFNVINGTINVIVIDIKSIWPYSAGDKKLVYNGINKNEINEEPKFPIVKIIVLVFNVLYLLDIFI